VFSLLVGIFSPHMWIIRAMTATPGTVADAALASLACFHANHLCPAMVPLPEAEATGQSTAIASAGTLSATKIPAAALGYLLAKHSRVPSAGLELLLTRALLRECERAGRAVRAQWLRGEAVGLPVVSASSGVASGAEPAGSKGEGDMTRGAIPRFLRASLADEARPRLHPGRLGTFLYVEREI
jgi:hypothetical protein